MKLGEFIKKFSQNNLIRLHYKTEEGHKRILDTWDDVSMDWEVNQAKGPNRHYVNNEVLGIVGIAGIKGHYSDAINIVIEEVKNQPYIEEARVIENNNHQESC